MTRGEGRSGRGGGPSAADDDGRAGRLKAALQANVARRKAQTRLRAAAAAPTPETPQATAPKDREPGPGEGGEQ